MDRPDLEVRRFSEDRIPRHLNTKVKGEVSQMQVVAELVRRGFDVLLPVGDSLRYDLVVDLGIAFRRIQVKTARLRNGVLMFGTKSVNYEQGKIVHRHYRDGADDFIAYEPQTRAFYGILVAQIIKPQKSASQQTTAWIAFVKHGNSRAPSSPYGIGAVAATAMGH